MALDLLLLRPIGGSTKLLFLGDLGDLGDCGRCPLLGILFTLSRDGDDGDASMMSVLSFGLYMATEMPVRDGTSDELLGEGLVDDDAVVGAYAIVGDPCIGMGSEYVRGRDEEISPDIF
jgi:hypothetical protein